MVLLREGKPVGALLNLARRHGIEVGDDVTGQKLSQMMQERWLRKTEHQYQIPGGPPSDDDLTLLKKLGLVEAASAPQGQYDGALVVGATIVAVRKRLAFLAEQHHQGVTVKTVCLLGGARPLDKDKESPTVLCTLAELPFKEGWTPPTTLPTTEGEMMQFVFEQSALPSEWEGVFINAPLQPTPDGKTRHPNTTDTVKELLKDNPKPGTYVVVSSQPFVARQTWNVMSVLPTLELMVIGIGYAAAPTTPLKTFLDEIARLLYEETQAKQ